MLRLHKPNLKLPIRRTGAHKEDGQVLSRGQIIVIFAAALPVLIGILGLAIDVSFAWINELRIQKTADAAALAGAVYLPDNATGAHNAALAAAVQNGYTGGTGSLNGSPNVSISAARNEPNHQQMDVSITAPVETFFLRVFGINYMMATRSAHAQYNLPLPMGSPLNVFGNPTTKDLQGNALNYWAAIQGPCTLKANGDPYATKDTTSATSNCSASSKSNTEYKAPSSGDPGAYDYTIKVPVSGTLSISLYDPEFCARSAQGDDTGDTTFSSANFNTVFTLYNPSSTPYLLGSYTVAASASYPGDGSTATNDGQSGATHSCSSYYVTTDSTTHDYKGKWLGFASIAAAPGSYRLNIQTNTGSGSSPSTSAADGSNMYAIQATLNGGSGTQPDVYGGAVGTMSSMSIYNNLAAGTSYIYLAQINATNAGKALVLDLFDPGDLSGTGVMYFEMPTTSGWTDASFSWRDSGTSLSASGTLHSGVTSVTTASGGTSNFQGHWLVVTIAIPGTYTAPQNGWWKIKYVITGGAAHDRTTWNAQVIDIPVHLVPG
ncbi:MAG: pilus assembly protein TadG-related protein [Candidatus Limnocylindrales bacterium]|jgi:hypothetical protein